MITQHTDTYWTNRFGARFPTEEGALKDEKIRMSRPMKLTCPAGGLGELQFESIEVVGPENGVWGESEPYWNNHRVYPLSEAIKKYQSILDTYGENVGWMRVHQGMGHYADVIVTWGDNLLHKEHYT